MFWRFDVDFGIDFGIVNLKNSGDSPILQFSIVLHFPMCSVERNPFCATWGRLWGWWLKLRVDSSGTNMLFYSSIFHVIALPWLWTQTCTSEFLPGRVMGFGYNSILGWLYIYDSPPINIWYLDLATIYSGQTLKKVRFEGEFHMSLGCIDPPDHGRAEPSVCSVTWRNACTNHFTRTCINWPNWTKMQPIGPKHWY